MSSNQTDTIMHPAPEMAYNPPDAPAGSVHPSSVPEATAFAAPPIKTLEDQLLDIWRELLAQPAIDCETTFIEAGGHSLTAMQLLNTIEKRTGHRLQPHTLVTAPSVSKQAALITRIRMATPEAGEPIAIRVQIGGDSPPQFIVPGYGDTLVGIHRLAREMGSERPFYILDPAAFDPAGKGFDTLPQLASAMVTEMRRIRPRGPHHICGHSLGAHLVWEIARQLESAGLTPGAVTLLDSDAPGYPTKVMRPLRWAMKLAAAGRNGPKQLASLIKARWNLGFRDLINLPPRIFDADEKASMGAVADELERQWMATYRLCSHDTPGQYGGPVHLVRATIRKIEVGARDDDLQLGWGRFATRPITVLPIESDHWQILNPKHAAALAVLLKRAILG